MSRPVNGSGRLAVGHLSFDPVSGELVGPVGVERIAPQPAALLALLASHPDAVVTRDEIREHLWPGGRVEFEQGIAFAVREVRKAIEAAGGDPALVETIPKRGFRLVAAAAAPNVAPPAAPAPVARAESWRAFLRPLVMLAIVGSVGLAVLLRGASPESLPAIVIFVHDTEVPEHVEVARALGFELTTRLTRTYAGRLGVVGPTGTTTLAGPNDTEGARASLGACLVISGGIRPFGADSVIVFTQIVRTSDRFHAWAATDTVPVSTAAAAVQSGVVAGVEIAASVC